MSPSIYRLLLHYFLFSYFFLAIHVSGYLKTIVYEDAWTAFFAIATYLSYSFLYLLPPFLLVLLVAWVSGRAFLERFWKTIRLKREWVVYCFAVLGFSGVHLTMYIDKMVFKMFGFHLNGFVWNLVFTEGGLDSMGSDGGSFWSLGLRLFFFLFLQGFLLFSLIFSNRFQIMACTLFRKATVVCFFLLIGLAFSSQGVVYGMSSFKGHSSVLAAARAFPFYIPITFRRVLKASGLQPSRNPSFEMKSGKSLQLRYPLLPVERKKESKRYNIVWLVAESLRADMVTEEIMPASWGLAQKGVHFQNHYSGGNGTRMAMFAMFYGLYGNYWFSFLAERRPPLLMEILAQDHYEMEMFTSALFSYPEFDKTIFAGISQDKLHRSEGLGWEKDRKNVTGLLEFLDRRDRSRPFMTFMFFESPHARYYFPPETVIRKPYLEEFNYVTADLKKDIPLIKNRYVNSCRHLDTQIERILQYLERNGMMDSTLVIVTGDHGEEFMEKGYWGHNTVSYTEEQVRTPLILWAPGVPHRRVEHVTSHLDIPATVLSLLGISNPPEDYSLGMDLLGDRRRDYVVFSSWDDIGYRDKRYKASLPLNAYDVSGQKITTADDGEVKDRDDFYRTCRKNLMEILKGLSRFSK